MTAQLARRQLIAAAITSFDRVVLCVVAALVVAVGLTVFRGDRIGVQLMRFTPVEEARPASVVTLQFNEDMNRGSVAARFHLEPPVSGEIRWSGRTMTFRPSAALETGSALTVVLEAGAESDGGRKLLADRRFQFTVRGPRVAYLAPVDGSAKDLWIADLARPQPSTKQLTRSVAGIVAFDVSPDGGTIAYAERNPANGADLKLLDLDTGEVRQLATCGGTVCTNPVWSPNGTQIAFERQGSTASAIPGLLRDSTRVWLVDAHGTPPTTRPLFEDPQVPSHGNPRWAPDGTVLALAVPVGTSASGPGVLFHNLASGVTRFRPAAGPAGTFSADGTHFVLPAFIPRGGQMQTLLDIVDLATLESVPASESPMAPSQISWGPGEDELTVDQRTVGDEKSLGRQIYTLDLQGGPIRPLLTDASFDHSFFSWEPTGRRLVMERSLVRSPDAKADARSQIWLYDAEHGVLTQVAVNAFYPRWVK